MAIVAQRRLFCWNDVDAASDLQRLRVVLEAIPDEGLMKELEGYRGRGRNDYPVRAMWNSIVAALVFGHESVESLRREMARNGELRWMCGFDVLQGSRAVPSKDAYTHFLRNLLKRADRIEAMFGEVLRRLSEVLPDLGRHLAVDGKELNTAAAKRSNEDTAELRAKHGARPDGRRDLDAEWGVKGKPEGDGGSALLKTHRWFGYKLHLLVDSLHELPLAYEVTPANEGEQPWLMKLVERLDGSHPEIVSRAEEIAADKGYDTVENCSLPFDRYGIKPVIAIRDVRNDGETSWLLNPKKPDNVTYTYDGCVRCTCFVSDEERAMAFCGYEADRRTLKYRCPAKVHGFPCRGRGRCPRGLKRAGKIVRIPLETDRRVFTPLARGTQAWKRAYARRTAVERVNSRFDQVYGFEHHHIRGLAKMRVRVGLAFVVMLANALGWIRAKQAARMRSLLTPLPQAA